MVRRGPGALMQLQTKQCPLPASEEGLQAGRSQNNACGRQPCHPVAVVPPLPCMRPAAASLLASQCMRPTSCGRERPLGLAGP